MRILSPYIRRVTLIYLKTFNLNDRHFAPYVFKALLRLETIFFSNIYIHKFKNHMTTSHSSHLFQSQFHFLKTVRSNIRSQIKKKVRNLK
jgi:hypothetical protein